jgi:protein SCO1/2
MASTRRTVVRAVRLVLAGSLAAGCAGAGGATGEVAKPAANRSSLHGLAPDRPAARPRLTLTDTSGAAYDFAARTRGRVTLLFWGYTRCEDICPTTMADIAVALRRVPESVRRSVTVVFATTDPEQDTAPVVRRWLDRFDPSFVGLTGTAAQLAAAQRAAGVPVAVRERLARGNYAVDHFAGVTAYGRDDRVAAVYPAGAIASDYATDLPVLVKEGS